MTRELARHPGLIVVRGGGISADGTPTPSTIARAEAAAALAQTSDLAIIVSGSHGDGPPPARTEASYMAGRLRERGVAPERIFLEDQSRDTLSNAAFVAERYLQHIAPRPLIVVTSPFHLARSVETFRLVLGSAWRIDGYAAPVGTNDDAHAANEALYLARTRARLEGIAAGDVARIARRVRETLPTNVSDEPV